MTLPFKPSEKYIEGMNNCSIILEHVPIARIQKLEHEINHIGYNHGLIPYIRNLSVEDGLVLVTAALATLYTQEELRK